MVYGWLPAHCPVRTTAGLLRSVCRFDVTLGWCSTPGLVGSEYDRPLMLSPKTMDRFCPQLISHFSCLELSTLQPHLHLRYPWSLARGVTRCSFQFIPIFPCFSPMLATHTQEGNTFTSSPEGQEFHLHRHTVRSCLPAHPLILRLVSSKRIAPMDVRRFCHNARYALYSVGAHFHSSSN